VGNEPPFFHHGLFTTLRQSVLAHHGEAESSRASFVRSSEYERDSLIEFLKGLQVLPPGTKALVVDDKFRKKAWLKWRPSDVDRKVTESTMLSRSPVLLRVSVLGVPFSNWRNSNEPMVSGRMSAIRLRLTINRY
jgi:hypothetical protein